MYKMFVYIIGCLFILFGTTSCGFITGSSNAVVDKTIKTADKIYPDDNALEEKAEDVIYNTTGLKTDLSPDSPEASDQWEGK